MHGTLEYPKKSSGDAMHGDEYGDISMKPDDASRAKGGGSSSSGPTGSSRSYPKGSKVKMSADFNPQKTPASKIYVGGVD